MSEKGIRARVTMLIYAPPSKIFEAFVAPDFLTKFWLKSSSAKLNVGQPVDWHFMVEGATAKVIATHLDDEKRIAWKWEDGQVDIELEQFEDGTAVTLVNGNFPGEMQEQFEAALNGTEGFTIVLCDLKTLLESGKSAGLTKAKARLIESRCMSN